MNFRTFLAIEGRLWNRLHLPNVNISKTLCDGWGDLCLSSNHLIRVYINVSLTHRDVIKLMLTDVILPPRSSNQQTVAHSFKLAVLSGGNAPGCCLRERRQSRNLCISIYRFFSETSRKLYGTKNSCSKLRKKVLRGKVLIYFNISLEKKKC